MLYEAIREQSEYAVKLILSVVATNTWNGANNIPVVKIRVICTPLKAQKSPPFGELLMITIIKGEYF